MTVHIIGSSPESPDEFFKNALGEALEKEKVSVSAKAHDHLVQLLVRQIDKGYHPDETLSDRFARAFNTSRAGRNRSLREVGDMALIFCGLWWEYQYRPLRPSHARFHMDMGRRAYGSIGEAPYEELAAKISGVVDALIRMGTDHSLKSARDVLRLYMLWQDTHSPLVARVLLEQGMMVMPMGTRTLPPA